MNASHFHSCLVYSQSSPFAVRAFWTLSKNFYRSSLNPDCKKFPWEFEKKIPEQESCYIFWQVRQWYLLPKLWFHRHSIFVSLVLMDFPVVSRQWLIQFSIIESFQRGTNWLRNLTQIQKLEYKVGNEPETSLAWQKSTNSSFVKYGWISIWLLTGLR